MDLTQEMKAVSVLSLSSEDLGKRITVVHKNVAATGTLQSLTHRFDWDGKARKTGVTIKEGKWEWSEHACTEETEFYYSPKEEEVDPDQGNL